MTQVKNFIPSGNPLFNAWQLNFVTKVNSFRSAWGWIPIVDDEWDLLTVTTGVKKLKYDAAWLKVSSKLFDSADEQRLLDARQEYESGDKKNPSDTSTRMFINRHIRYNPLVTNDQKIDIGLIVPDTLATATTDSNADISSGELVGNVKSYEHLIHKNTVTIPGQTSKNKGEGVDEIEVFIAFTDAMAQVAPPLNEFKYDGEVKRGLYTRIFTADQEGFRAWYYARKRIKGKKISFGPPSKPWSGIIP